MWKMLFYWRKGNNIIMEFFKYEGTGNDFIMIDNRVAGIQFTENEIVELCDRNRGIGADGVILIEMVDDADFYMRYYNSDGSQVGMCGNGGRCISLFAHHLGIGGVVKKFRAKDGLHTAEIMYSDDKEGFVKVRLIDIVDITKIDDNNFSLNSGVPHHVRFVDDVTSIDVECVGREIRYSVDGGTNVNFVQIIGNLLVLRTYERGVEGETLACGTGATAAAVAAHSNGRVQGNEIDVRVLGGELKITFDNNYCNVWLAGAARRVFKGTI